MRAVVLVGGEGTRLRPLTLTTPKPMLRVAGVPIIERVLGALRGFGVDEAVLSMGYKPDAFLQTYPDGVCAGVRVSYAVDPEPLDTAGAIRYAALEGGVDETFLAVNGDVLTDWDVSDLIAFHRQCGAEATIALTPVADPSAFGVVPTDGDGRVTAFIEKPAPGEAPTNLINAGLYVLEPSVLDRIPGTGRVNVERETFPALVADRTLFALASDAWWTDTGTPVLYRDACLHLSGGGSVEPDASVDPSAAVSKSVVEAGVHIGAGASVQGSVILAGARIGEGAVVDGSIVGPDAVIGAGAVVSNLSVIGAAATVEPGQQVDGARIPS